MITRVGGFTEVICLVASMPSMPGIRTSMSTTSGRSSPVRRTASAPSAASPMTSMSAWALRIMAKPCRSSG